MYIVKIPSEELMETCSIFTILYKKNSKIISGDEIRKAFQNYKKENIEKHIIFMWSRTALTVNGNNGPMPIKQISKYPISLNLLEIKDIRINYKSLLNLIKYLGSQINGKRIHVSP